MRGERSRLAPPGPPTVLALALGAALLGACRPAGPLPEVRVHATVSPLGAQALVTLANNRRLARVVLVADAREADLAWFGDPAQAIAAGPLLVPGSAPAQPEVEARWKDPARRFFPLCARARVLLVNPRAVLPIQPRELRDLSDPRLAGRQALVPFGRGAGPATAAALASVFGEEPTFAFLAGVARQRPQTAPSDDAVQAMVASGAADVGLAGSEQGAAGAASAAGLEVVYPDQAAGGTLVFPTAVALLVKGGASEAALALADWMAGSDAEQLLAARAPGYLPLRGEVPLPAGVRSATAVRSLRLDWERVAALERSMSSRLASWPTP
jgi:iron(III) transport system substrate-binding protein